MYVSTKNILNAILGSAFLIGLVSTAVAQETALTHNERASQSAIVDSTDHGVFAGDESAATLASNEAAARHVIFDVAPSTADRLVLGEPTLIQNELAARRSIASDTSETDVGRTAATLSSAASSSPSAR